MGNHLSHEEDTGGGWHSRSVSFHKHFKLHPLYKVMPNSGLIAYRVISPIIKPSEKDSWNVSKRSITVQLRDQTRPTLDTYNIVVTTKTVTRVEIDPTLTLDRTDYGATDRRGSNGSVTINSHSPSVHGVGDTYHLGSLGTVNELDRESSRNSVRHFNQSGIPHSL